MKCTMNTSLLKSSYMKHIFDVYIIVFEGKRNESDLKFKYNHERNEVHLVYQHSSSSYYVIKPQDQLIFQEKPIISLALHGGINLTFSTFKYFILFYKIKLDLCILYRLKTSLFNAARKFLILQKFFK